MKTKFHSLFVVPALAALAFSLLAMPRTAVATLVNVSPFTPSAPTITFDEFPVGTVDPSITLTASGIGNVTVSFTGTTATDTTSDSSPVLGGLSGFFGNVSMSFSMPVASVGFKAGFFDNVGSTAIQAFDASGNSLGIVNNNATGFIVFSLADSSGLNVIKSVNIFISGNEPAGFEIDNVAFKILNTGSLLVYLYPSGAVSAGAQWQVDGGPFQNNGSSVGNLSVGNHTVSYKTIPDWITPPNQLVNVTAGSTTITNGSYVTALGAVQVTINPAGAVSAGAQWQIDGGAFQNSGSSVGNLSVGNHTVSFKTIPGWLTPSDQLVNVVAGNTTSSTGTYVTAPGAVQVTINPSDAVSAGAQWQVDGGAFQTSGAIVNNLAPGNHTVSFSSVSGWITPSNQTVVVASGSTNFATATYLPDVGALQVTINPAGAASAGAQWQVDGGAFQTSGSVVTNLAVGNHTVSFSTIPNWISPSNQTVTVAFGATNSASATYLPSGALQVTLSPAGAVSAGAQWQVDGGTFQLSGAILNNLPVGSHTVSFNTIPNWITPSNQTVTVAFAATNMDTANYLPIVGALQVNISPPEAVSAGAQWQVDGGAFHNSGTVLTNLPVGTHTVSFNTVSGWVAPGNISASVNANSTNTYAGTYTVAPSAVQVTILPVEAALAGAEWQLDGGTFLPSGYTLNGLSAGTHTVAFNNISGWIRPTNQTVTLTPGNSATPTGTYSPIDGLQVTLVPICAAVAGAQWRVDGGPFQNSGTIVTNLDVGKHIVSFNSVVGWSTPGNQTVLVNAGSNTLATAVYTQGSTPGTITWINVGAINHNWSNTNNWDLNRAPTNSDIVLIPYTDGTNCILDVSATVAGLHIGDCPEGGSDGLNLNGQTLIVTGPIVIQSSASLTLNHNSTLIGTNAVINGVLGWTAGTLGGTFALASNSVLNITSGGFGHSLGNCVLTNYGTVNWNDDALNGGGSPGTFIYNYGLWNAQGDQSLTPFFGGNGIVFDNFGTFRKSGGTSGGFSQMPGGVIFNNTGSVDVQQGNLRLAGGGNFTGGSVTTNGAGTMLLAAGNYNLNGTVTGTNLVQKGGSLTGTNVINGALTWQSGAWDGAIITVASNSVVNIYNGGFGHSLGNCILTNYGTVNWSDDALNGGGSPGTFIYNYGLWNAQGDQTLTPYYGGNGIVFNNFGTFRKSGGAGGGSSSQVVATFNHFGTLDVQQGNLFLVAGGSFSGGQVTANTAGLAVLKAGSYNLNGTTTGTNFVENGGNLTGTNVIKGGFTWQSGAWSGTVVTVASNSVLNLISSGSHVMDNCSLTNYGAVNWSGATVQGGGSSPGTFIRNFGLWNAQDDQPIYANYGGNGVVFDNLGTFRKSGGVGGGNSSQIGVTFNNPGTLDTQIGNVNLLGAYSLAGGTLSFGLNSLTSFGKLNLSGSAALNGPLSVKVSGNFAPAIGNQFQVVSASGVSGTFGSVNVPAGISVTYSNNGVYLVVIGAVPVQILAPQLAGTNFVFQFATASGQSYTVQRNDDLATTNWVYYTNLVGSGSVFQFQTPVTVTPAKRFFRVREP